MRSILDRQEQIFADVDATIKRVKESQNMPPRRISTKETQKIIKRLETMNRHCSFCNQDLYDSKSKQMGICLDCCDLFLL